MKIPSRKHRVLFLCTGNSARSVLGEYLLRDLAPDRFETHSAGSDPKPAVNPYTVRVLRDGFGLDASDARSKSGEELRHLDFDTVITVCDNAKESCPIFPGRPTTLHWPFEDPAAFEGSDEDTVKKFTEISRQIQSRLEIFSRDVTNGTTETP